MKKDLLNKGKRGSISIIVLVIGVVMLCIFTIVSFLLSGKINRADDIGVEATNSVNSKIEAFNFYVNLGFSESEAARKIGAETEGDILVIEEKLYSGVMKKEYISVGYRRRIYPEIIQPET